MTIQTGKTIGLIMIIAVVSIFLIGIDSAGGTGGLVVVILFGLGIYAIIRFAIQHAIKSKSEQSRPATPPERSTSEIGRAHV